MLDKFDAFQFIANLKWMGLGLLGTFLIIGIIIGATILFNYTANRIAAERAAKAAECVTKDASQNDGNE